MPRDTSQEPLGHRDATTAQRPTGRVAPPRHLLLGISGERAQGGWALCEPLLSPSSAWTGPSPRLCSPPPCAEGMGGHLWGAASECTHMSRQALCFNTKVIRKRFLRYTPPRGPCREVF